jgi:predicted secreted protein
VATITIRIATNRTATNNKTQTNRVQDMVGVQLVKVWEVKSDKEGAMKITKTMLKGRPIQSGERQRMN